MRPPEPHATLRCIALAFLIAWMAAFGAAAHDVPADVRINAFVRPLGDRLQLLIRVPMQALQDVDFPRRGPGYLDLTRADESLRNAARLWIIDNIDLFEDG